MKQPRMARRALSLVPVLLVCIFASAQPRAADAEFELATEPLTFSEAFKSVGYPGSKGVGANGLKLAIIDGGFDGLDEWLDKNELAKKNTFKATPLKTKGTHGFRVYRVARAVLPDANIYLYEMSLKGSEQAKQFPKIVKDMADKGIRFANLSIGNNRPNFRPIEDRFRTILDLFEKHKVTAVFSVGNERELVHTWKAEKLRNGYIVVSGEDGSESSGVQFFRRKEKGTGYLWWQHKKDDPPITITLKQKHKGKFYTLKKFKHDGEKVVTQTSDGKKTTQATPGVLKFELESMPDPGKYFWVMISVGEDGERFVGRNFFYLTYDMKLHVRGGNNADGSYSPYGKEESPFVITVGGMARQAEGGKIAPTDFSSYGITPSGNTLPHVMGPGILTLSDGTFASGTSMAAPFVTSVLSAVSSWRQYNPKNVAERISTHDYLTANPEGPQRSRWGVPDAQILLQPDKLREKLAPNKLENVTHRVEDGRLILSGEISRCCMEGIDARVVAIVGQVITRNGKKSLKAIKGAAGAKTFTTGAKNYDKKPVEIRIDASKIPADAKQLVVQFGIQGPGGGRPAPLPTGKPYLFAMP